MSSEALRWNAIASSISTLLGIAAAIAIVAVVATVVRRHRPDAYRGLLAWSIGQLVLFGVNVVGFPLLAVVSGGSDGYMTAMSVFRILVSIAHLVLVVVLVRGLVAIAQPPKPIRIGSDAPYR